MAAVKHDPETKLQEVLDHYRPITELHPAISALIQYVLHPLQDCRFAFSTKAVTLDSIKKSLTPRLSTGIPHGSKPFSAMYATNAT